MKTHTIPKGSSGVHFQFDNPHNLKISKPKGTLLKDGKVIMPSTDMRHFSGMMYFLPISTALEPGNYVIAASGMRGEERISARIALKIARQSSARK